MVKLDDIDRKITKVLLKVEQPASLPTMSHVVEAARGFNTLCVLAQTFDSDSKVIEGHARKYLTRWTALAENLNKDTPHLINAILDMVKTVTEALNAC